MADEQPLSAAEIEMIRQAYANSADPKVDARGLWMPRLLATVADLQLEVAVNAAAHDLAVRLDIRLAALEREHAAYREIVAAVAALELVSEFDHENGYEDVRYDVDAVDGIRQRARAMLGQTDGTPAPAQD